MHYPDQACGTIIVPRKRESMYKIKADSLAEKGNRLLRERDLYTSDRQG